MVCANSPIPYSLELLKKEALKNLCSIQHNFPKPDRILIVGSESKGSWRSLSLLDKFDIEYVDSVHYMLRSGIYQNYSLFGFEDTSYEVSKDDFKALLSARTSNSIMILAYNQLKEMTNDHFNSLLSEMNAENLIQNAISRIEKDMVNLNSRNDFEFNYNHRDFKSDSEKALKEYLRSHLDTQFEKPEEILKGAINLIRPQK